MLKGHSVSLTDHIGGGVSVKNPDTIPGTTVIDRFIIIIIYQLDDLMIISPKLLIIRGTCILGDDGPGIVASGDHCLAYSRVHCVLIPGLIFRVNTANSL